MMEDLFKFYTVRAPVPLDPARVVSLDSGSAHQAAMRGAPDQTLKKAAAERHLASHAQSLASWTTTEGKAVLAFMAWLKQAGAPNSLTPASFDEQVRARLAGAFAADVPTLRQRFAVPAHRELLRDALISLRVLNPTAEKLHQLVPVDAHLLAGALVHAMRLELLFDKSPQQFEKKFAVDVFDIKLTSIVFADAAAGKTSAAPGVALAKQLSTARATLARLSEFLEKYEKACPLLLEMAVLPPSVVASPTPPLPLNRTGPRLNESTRARFHHEFEGLPLAIETALNGGVAPSYTFGNVQWLVGAWMDVYAFYERKAVDLQRLIDGLQLQLSQQGPGVPVTNQAPTPGEAGYLRRAGMTEVQVVRTHVDRYEGSEIARIENVLKGEKRNRRFRSLQRSEEETRSESEKQVTEEKELKSEDKSTLKSSIDELLKENLDLKVGFDLKAKVGENIQIGLNSSFGFSRSKEEAKKAATEFAKDVTNRAARKASETVRASIVSKLLKETEETVDHGFEASGTNVVGIYQWVEKVNRVQLFTIDDEKRAVIDGVLLQPGQRLLGMPPTPSTPGLPVAPPALDVTASSIFPWNYLSIAAKYGATGVSAPPPLTSSASFSSANPQGEAFADKEMTYSVAQDLAVPGGTGAAWANITLIGEVVVSLEHEHLVATLGAEVWTAIGDGTDVLKPKDNAPREIKRKETRVLAGEKLMLPFTLYASRVHGYSVSVDVTCVRSAESLAEWQMGVYGAIKAAHAKAVQDFAERTARATLEEAYQVGPSPLRAESTIREELKRMAIAVLAKQNGPGSYYGDLDALYGQGRYAEVAQQVLFFEHALEWENMTYILYPYFWADGRENGWARHLERNDKSDTLLEFMRAGAARIVVPVRPIPKEAGSTGADYSAYLGSMSLPSLPELLDVDSPLYLAIEDELKARSGAATPVAFDDEWEVRLPTELLRLREGEALPTWKEKKDASGAFIKGKWEEELM